MNVMILDTETTNDIECPICYEVAFQIFDLETGRVKYQMSMINRDIFLDRDMMEHAYFKDFIPEYWRRIHAGESVLLSWYDIKQQLRLVMAYYDVFAVMAHNARFDYRSLHTTQRYITTSRYRYILPYGVEWWDTLKMAREALGNDGAYKNFCLDHHFTTAKGKPKLTAEVLFRYITKDLDFIEEHKALDDCEIERKIFLWLMEHYPTLDKELWGEG